MPKKATELPALQVKRLRRPGNHAVGGVAGLHLQITDTGARSWILRAVVGKKRRDIGLGGYPDVTLDQARQRARAARDQIRQGIDPVDAKRAVRTALIAEQARTKTFDECATACHKARAASFRNAKHRADWISSIHRYASPVIGKIPVSDVTLPHILKVLEPIWEGKTETATRLRQRLEAVLSWATVRGYRIGENPARWKGHLSEVLPDPQRRRRIQHYPALPWNKCPEFMTRLREQKGIGARALELIILTAARSGEVRGAVWEEFDLDAKLWTVPAERIKAGKTHRVPLSPDAVKLLKSLPRIGPYIFTSPRGGMLSDMSISGVCRRMGVDAVPHGFRSSFKDWARNRSRYADEVSELALAHVNSDATRAAYARDELLPQRTRMMNDWAKFLNSPVQAGKVVPIRAKA